MAALGERPCWPWSLRSCCCEVTKTTRATGASSRRSVMVPEYCRMSRVARTNQVKTEKTGKCMVLWLCPARKVELDRFGSARGAKRYTCNLEGFFQFSTVENPVWFMVYGFEIIKYGQVLKLCISEISTYRVSTHVAYETISNEASMGR